MPAAIDPSIVKIAVELENHTAQLIEFDQKSTLTGKMSHITSECKLFKLVILWNKSIQLINANF